jgi:hypothetical protein
MNKTSGNIAIRILLALAFVIACGCAASRASQYTYDRRLLAEADDHFDKKRYPEALKIYQDLASSPAYSQTASAKQALYKIGYINIYYDNPKADPRAALDAFNSFRARYPDDKLIGEVNTLTKILVVLKGFEDQYDETSARIRRLQTKTAMASGSLDTLLESIQRCSTERDSLDMEKSALLKKISELEQTIVKMEKTR